LREKTPIFERRITDSTGSMRLVIPPEIARGLKLIPGDVVSLWMEGDCVVFRKK
jgi:hypothetical protein